MVDKTDLLSLIKSKENKFTKTDLKISEYIKSHLNEIIFMSITELTDATETSEGSLVRFCQKLGFKGFHPFKIALATQQSNYSENNSKNLTKEDLITLKDEITRQNLETVKRTSEMISIDSFEKAITKIISARKIVLLGSGASGNSARELFYGLMRLGLNIVCEADVHYDAMIVSHLSKEDVVVSISQSGSTFQVVDISTIAKKQGATVISITSHNRSPLAQLSDIVLLIPGRTSPFESGQIPSRAAQLFAVKLLTLGISAALHNSKEAIKKTADSVAQWIY